MTVHRQVAPIFAAAVLLAAALVADLSGWHTLARVMQVAALPLLVAQLVVDHHRRRRNGTR